MKKSIFLCFITTLFMANTAVSADKLSLPLGWIDDCTKTSNNHEAAKICGDLINSTSDLKVQKNIFYTGLCYTTSSPVMDPRGVFMIITTYGDLIVDEEGVPHFHQLKRGILPREIRPQLRDMIGSRWSFISDESLGQIVWAVGKDPGDFIKKFSEFTKIQNTDPNEIAQLQKAIYDGIQQIMFDTNPLMNLPEDELEELKRKRFEKPPTLFRSEEDSMVSHYQDNNVHWFRSAPNEDILAFSVFGTISSPKACRLKAYK